MLLENLMAGAFCCDVGARLAHHIRKISFADCCKIFTHITFGIDFIFGVIWQSRLGNTWTTMLCCAGAYLTYVTFVFSRPTNTSTQIKEVIEHD